MGIQPPPTYAFDVYYYLAEAAYQKTADVGTFLQNNLSDFTALTPKHFSQWKICAFVDQANQRLIIAVRGTDNLANAVGDVAHHFFEPKGLLKKMEDYIREAEKATGLTAEVGLGHSEGGHLICRLLEGKEKVTLSAHKALAAPRTYNLRLPHDGVSKKPISKAERYITLEGENHAKAQGHGLKGYREFRGKKWNEICPDRFVPENDAVPDVQGTDLAKQAEPDTEEIVQADLEQEVPEVAEVEIPVSLMDGVSDTFFGYFKTTFLLSYIFKKVFPSKEDAKKTEGEKIGDALLESTEKGGVAAGGRILLNAAVQTGYIAASSTGMGVGVVVKVYSDVKGFFYPPPVVLPDSKRICQQTLEESKLFSPQDKRLISTSAALSKEELEFLLGYLQKCSADELLEFERLQSAANVKQLKNRIRALQAL